MVKKVVIIDTDVGGDPDDVFALLFALNSPELDVQLVLTNDEHRRHRAAFAKLFLQAVEKDAPVFAGADRGYDKYCVIEGLLEAGSSPVRDDWLPTLTTLAEQHDVIDYVCIGAQSNLAELIQNYPELKEKFRVTMMGGAIHYRHDHKAEHNVRYDIEAARVVFESNWDRRYVISDVTFTPELEIDNEHCFVKKLRQSEQSHHQLIIKNMDAFFAYSRFQSTIMHDPLTVMSVFDDQVVQFEQKLLQMDGIGRWSESPNGKATMVATRADYDRFWQFFSERTL